MGFARQEYWSGLPLPSPFILSESQNNYVVMLKKNQNWKVVTAININSIWKKFLKYCNRGKRLHFRSRLNVENKEKEEFRPLGWEDSPGEGKGYSLQYSGLKNSVDCIVHGVTQSWT